MQIRWRKNPKTEDGWWKRTAISSLVGVAGFVVVSPIAFVLMAGYLRRADPGDMQTLLGAMTSAVLVGLVAAGLGFLATMMGLWVLSLRGGDSGR